MRRMKDRSVDLVLADFPYGKNLDYAGYDDTLENLKSLIAKVMPQILRVGRFVMITCGTDRISFYPPQMMSFVFTNRQMRVFQSTVILLGNPF
jgi:hypothetical protein